MTPAAATHTHQVSTPISSVGSGAPGVEDFSNKKKTTTTTTTTNKQTKSKIKTNGNDLFFAHTDAAAAAAQQTTPAANCEEQPAEFARSNETNLHCVDDETH
jgi:hypothetical protein